MSVYKKHNAIRNSISAKRWMFSSALTAVSMAAMAVPTQAADPAHSWADLNQDAGGFTTNTVDGNITNIKLNTERAIGSGNADIYTGHTVNVDGALLAVRDTKSDPTRILGNLNSNGKIIIIDANGVFFGKNSMVDVVGLVTTTGNIDNNQLLNNDFGDYVIENVEGGGAIELNGMVNISEAGLAAFVSPFVINNGIINAKLGKVVMASGETVTLDLYGDGLLEVTVDGELSDALIENKGVINAEGGTVQITALAAKDVVDNIINMEGIINVASVTQKGGKIILSGGSKGKVEVSGVLAASGKTEGGSVEATGQNVDVAEEAVIVADAGENGDGGSAYFYGDDYTVFSGTLSARGGSVSGNGGNAEISAGNSVGYYGYTDLSAANGEIGTLLIDPEHLIISDAAFSGDLDFWSTFTEGGTVNINDQALADTLRVANVNLWATETLSTGSDIDISEYNHYVSQIIGWNKVYAMGRWFRTTPIIRTLNYNGITGNNLTVAAPEVNLVHDITLGNGALNVADLTTTDSVGGFGIVNPPHDIIVDHLNLDGRVYKRSNLGDASFTTLADDAQINTTAGTINVLSSNALIQQAIQFATTTDPKSYQKYEYINVSADTYAENLLIDRSIKLRGLPGAVLQYDVANVGSGVVGNLITVTARSNIEGFVFDGLGLASNGIYADGVPILQVYDNTFQGFTKSNVNVKNGAGIMIYDNAMTGSETSVMADNTYDIKINDNVINDATVTGVHVKNSGGPDYRYDIDIWGNTITSSNNTTTGVLVENSAYATVGLEQNPYASGYPGGNKISGGGNGIVITDSDNSIVRYNTVEDVAKTGVTITNSDYATVSLNKIEAKTTGVNASSSDDLVIDHNDISSTVGPNGPVLGDGIFVKNSKRMNVNNNTIHDIGDDGIQGNNTDGAVVANNTITNVGDAGIALISGSSNVTVTDNTITNASSGFGIRTSGGGNVTITGNELTNTGDANRDFQNDAIHVDGSYSTGLVDDNTIDGAAHAGIEVEDVDSGITVSNNEINDAEVGIYNNGSNGTQITGNTITNVVDGILVNPSASVTVSGNDIDVAINGIRVMDSDDATISNNKIDDASNAGIYVSGSDDTQIVSNEINDNGASTYAQYGILVEGGNSVDVDDNKIEETTVAGIAAMKTTYIDIDGNLVKDGKGDGILVKGGHGADIYRNTVNNHGDDGIDVHDNDYVEVKYNTVNTTGLRRHDGDGIQVHDSRNADIYKNTVNYAGDDGIDVEDSRYVSVRNNNIYRSGDDGIDVEDSYDAGVYGNTVSRSRGDGIELSRSSYADIRGNNVRHSGDDGIDVDRAYRVDIVDNHVHGTRFGNGIEVTNSRSADVINNRVHYTGQDGIYVENSDYADIRGNDVHDTRDDGIDVRSSYKVDVVGNETRDTRGDGIQVRYSDRADIIGNSVRNAGDDGIDVENSDHVTVAHNDVTGSDNNGIEVDGGHGVVIAGNDVDRSGDNGIYVSNNYDAGVYGNTVSRSRGDGIELSRSAYADIRGNDVYHSGDDGIDVDRAYRVDIVDNHVHGTRYGNGIEVTNSRSADVIDNRVHYTGQDGIYVENSDYADIRGNDVHDTRDDGIDVRSSYKVDVVGNEIRDTRGDGIQVRHSNKVEITGNTVLHAGDDGIDVENSDNALILRNHVRFSDVNGIEVFDSDRTIIALNRVRRSGDDGINVNGGSDVLIVGNRSVRNGDDGIDVDDANGGVYIFGNKVRRNHDDGIDVNGAPHAEIRGNLAAGNWGNGIEATNINALTTLIVDGNTTRNNGEDGINASNLNTAYITNNTSYNNGDDGIEARDVDSTFILNNNIYENGEHGLAMLGWNNGDVVLEGNDFTDNPIGALFESGYIDISNLLEPNTFTNTDPSATPVGMIFDGPSNFIVEPSESSIKRRPIRGQLSIVGNTLGATKFTGFQNEGSFYVRIEDGTLLDGAGAPIVIDGLNAMFDGVRPSNTGGILEASVLNYIEDRLYDADDSPVNGRGQIFVGETPAGLDNIEDFFNKFFGFNPGSGRLNVTIAGLPSVGAGVPNPAAALNLIAPAAGGSEEPEDAAGELANIEPAAGGEKASCWGDAISAASGGATVNYSFGGSFEEALADASACSVTGL